MVAIYEHPHLVTADEIDDQGHVGNVHYLKWMQRAAVAHSSAQGWTPERYVELGAGWVVRSHFIEYLQPVFLDETLVVRTWVAGFERVQSLRRYRIVRQRDGIELARAETNWAFVDLHRRVPRRIPRELVEAFVVVDESSIH